MASDRGFLKLLCNGAVDALRVQTRYPKANYTNLTYSFCTLVLGALSAAGAVKEDHAYALIGVVIPCLKSQHPEFRALGGTLMARLFPALSLKAKVANRQAFKN